MKIAIRMDDITPDMDWKKFKEFKFLLDEYHVKPLIGVVPDNKDDNLNRKAGSCGPAPADFWQYIKELQENGWIVALHGYQHVYTERRGGLFPLNCFSEFAGVPFEKQCAMIQKGRDVLSSHGINTDIFMAPAHSYDRNTLRALKKTGFIRMTDGFGNKPYFRRGLIFYPISFRLENSLKKKGGVTTMVIHTNTMEENDFARCRRIFEKGEIISYKDFLEMEPVRRGWSGCAAEYVLACVKRLLVKLL